MSKIFSLENKGAEFALEFALCSRALPVSNLEAEF